MFQNMTKDFFHGIDIPLVLSAVKRTGLKVSDEVLDAARDAVADAIVSHDPSRQTSLNSWVCSYIQYQLGRYLAIEQGKPTKAKKHTPNYIFSLDDKVAQDDGATTLMHELIPSSANVEEVVMQGILKNKVHEAIEQLDERGKFIMNFCLQADSPSRCGRQLGEALSEANLVSYRGETGNKRARAQQLLKEYRGKMKLALEKMGIDSGLVQED